MATAHEVQDGVDRMVHAGYLRNQVPCPVSFRRREHILKLCGKGNGLVSHFRAMHKERLTDELIKESSSLLCKLHGEKTANHMIRVCQERFQKDPDNHKFYKVHHVNPKAEKTLSFYAKGPKEAAKCYGLILDHFGRLSSITGNPETVEVDEDNGLINVYKVWKMPDRIYTECIKPASRLTLPSQPTPLQEVTLPREQEVRNNTLLNYSTPEDILNSVYGYSAFRPGQKDAINAMLEGKDTIVIIPTGGGKTVTFSIPSMMRQGLSLVISPLIMLMYDQVTRLCQHGINTCYYNSLLTDNEKDFVLHNLQQSDCQYEFVFTSPEMALTDKFQACLDKLHKNGKFKFIIVDEAHCVEQWGEDFRKEYSVLHQLKSKYNVPFAALTGTATPMTIDIIKRSFTLNDPVIVKLSCLRPNLSIICKERKAAKGKEAIAEDIARFHKGQCGIVYCNTREESCQMAFTLQQHGLQATYYHAALDEGEKLQNAKLWLEGKVHIICCSCAFGMGIDKKDARFVFRINLPGSMEQLVQEGGRAGRDGDTATCTFYFSFSDRTFHLRNFSLIDNIQVQQQQFALLNKVTEFCFEKVKCRQEAMAIYFGETIPSSCNYCDNCQKTISVLQEQDMTEASKEIIQCLKELCNMKQHVKLAELVMTFMGSKAKEIIDQKLDRSDFYGKGKRKLRSNQQLTLFVQHLIIKGILKENFKLVQEKQCLIYLSCENTYDILENKTKVTYLK